MAHDGFPLLLIFGRRHRIRAPDRGIHRPDQRWAIQRDHLVEELHHVCQSGLLLVGRAAQVAVRAQTGADRAAGKAVAGELLLHIDRVDVGRVFDGDLDGVKAPALELRKLFCAVVGEGRGE